MSMSLENEFRLSFYKEIAVIDPKRQVRLVQHVETRRTYVYKKVPLQNREIFRLLQQNHYPYTPKIVELIEKDGQLVVIEQYINGTNLQALLEEKLFTEEETRELILQLCRILQPLHQTEPPIIHRDIKPSNIMVDDSGRLWLIDFDASKCFDPDKDRDTVLMGTADYAAPEQYGFSQSDPRTDIYSIGVLMNKMLTGQTPQNRLYEGALAPIIKKCTSLRPQDRYASTSKLASALQNPLRSTSFAPPGFRQRKLKYMIPAALWYFILVYCCMTAQFTSDQGQPCTGYILWVNRIFSTTLFLLETLYFGNYLNLRDRFPFKKRSSGIVNILRISLGALLVFFITAALAVLLE